MGYSIQLEISLHNTDPNRTRGKHWSQIRKTGNAIKREIALLSKGNRPKTPLDKFKIKIVRHAVKEMDWDNLVASLKPAIDALHLSQIIKNDSWKYIRFIDIVQVKSKTERKLVITVEEIQ